MDRTRTGDWGFVGWHYKALHRLGPLHNPFLVRVKGMENLPREGGFLYAANHSSYWDPIVLQITAPRPVNWLAKKEMMNNAFNKWFFFDKGGCIPVDRNARNPDAFKSAVQALHDGRIIGIFPESTRHVGKLGPAKSGVARLALESGAPIVPAAIASDKFWPPGQGVPKLTHKVYLNIGAPLRLEPEEDAHKATERVMYEIGLLLDEAKAARDAKAKWAKP